MYSDKPNIIHTPPGPKSLKVFERWNVSSTKNPGLAVFKEAKGIFIKDIDDNIYIDFSNQNINVGYNNDHVRESIKKQLVKTSVNNLPGITPDHVNIIEKMKQISPKALREGKYYFCYTGSEACEYAMELSRAYTERQILLAYLGGHYGWTIGALSLTADGAKNRRFCRPLVPEVTHIPYPYCYRCPFGQEKENCHLYCIDYIKNIFNTLSDPEDIASLFIEPIQQVGGVIIPPDKYMKEINKICKENGILFTVDEVATGFGKTGKMFGIDHFDVEIDMMFLGKSFGDGLQMAGILAKKGIMEKVKEVPLARKRPLLPAISALSMIEEIESRELLKNAEKNGKYLVQNLLELSEKYNIIGDVRGIGYLIGVELIKNNKKEPAQKETEYLIEESFKNGVLLGKIGLHKNVIRLTPPLITNQDQCDTVLNILEAVLKKIKRG